MPKFTYQNGLLPEFKELDGAIENGNLARVKELIHKNNINSIMDYKEGLPVIAAATAQGQIEIVKFLLEQKCQIDTESTNMKWTALSIALGLYAKNQNNNADIYQRLVFLLLQQGANTLHPSVNSALVTFTNQDTLKELIEKYRSLAEAKATTSPQTIFEIYFDIANIYLIRNELDKAQEYFLNALSLTKQHNLNQPPAIKKVLEVAFIISDKNPDFPKKRFPDEKLQENTDLFLQINLLREVALQGSQPAINYLAIFLKQTPLITKLTTVALLNSIPSLPTQIKKDCEELEAKNKDFINGLKALYGIDRKINALEAIKTFERIGESEKKSNIECAAFAYLQSATGHYHLALNSSDPVIISERIERAVQAHASTLKMYSQLEFFPISDNFDQLFKLLAIATQEQDKIIVIKTILAYYQAHNDENGLNYFKKVFATLQKVDFIKTHLETWQIVVDTLNKCHQTNPGIRNLFIQQLNELCETTDLPPKFLFLVKKSLADCYNRNGDKNSLQLAIQHYEAIEKLAPQAEEKFDLKTHRDIYRRFADLARTSSPDDSIKAYCKAAELGDVEAALCAAEVAEQDEKQIDLAIRNYEKAMREALADNHVKNMILTLKKALSFKQKFDLSTKQNEYIDSIIFSAKTILKDKSIIQSHLESLAEAYKIASTLFSAERLTDLFVTYSDIKKEVDFSEKIKKIMTGTDVIKNLLNEFKINPDIKNSDNIIKNNILQYISDALSSQPSFSIHPLIDNYSDDKTAQFQQNLLPLVEELLISKEKTHLNAKRALVSLYENQIKNSSPGEAQTTLLNKLIKVCKNIYFHSQTTNGDKNHYLSHLMKHLESKEHSIKVLTQDVINTIEYKQDIRKLKIHELAQKNYLPAIYDIFEIYKKPRFYGKPHIRRPLYLAAKILLLTLNRKDAENRFDLPKPQIDLMKAEANQILKKWADINLKELSENSEEYQYCKQANWYLEMIAKAGTQPPIDPDIYLLHETTREQHKQYDMTQVQLHLIEAMKQSLNVKNPWIQAKFDEIDACFTKAEISKQPSDDDLTLSTTLPTSPVPAIEPSAPPHEEHIASKTPNLVSLYPTLFASSPAKIPETEMSLPEPGFDKEVASLMTFFEKSAEPVVKKKEQKVENKREVILC